MPLRRAKNGANPNAFAEGERLQGEVHCIRSATVFAAPLYSQRRKPSTVFAAPAKFFDAKIGRASAGGADLDVPARCRASAASRHHVPTYFPDGLNHSQSGGIFGGLGAEGAALRRAGGGPSDRTGPRLEENGNTSANVFLLTADTCVRRLVQNICELAYLVLARPVTG